MAFAFLPRIWHALSRSSGALIVAASALATSCADVSHSSPPPSPLLAMETLIGDAACDEDSQCRTIGVGAKACGGPQAYVAWSSKRTDGRELQRAADVQARAAQADAQARGILSDCSVTPDPGAYCAVGADALTNPATSSRRCRLRTQGGAGKIY